MQELRYEPIPVLTKEEIELAISENDLEKLPIVVLSAALYSDDWKFAQDVCRRFSKNEDANVRGNAILGFGHIARIHGKLDEDVIGLVEAALHDSDKYVRMHAHDTAGDIEWFLNLKTQS